MAVCDGAEEGGLAPDISHFAKAGATLWAWLGVFHGQNMQRDVRSVLC